MEGQPIHARESVFRVEQSGPIVVLTDYTGLCAPGGSSGRHPGTNLLVFYLANPLTTGTFNAPHPIGVQWSRLDATCAPKWGNSVQSGTVTLTRADAAAGVAGNFDLIMGNGDHIAGSFDAPLCTAKSSGAASTCTPL